MVSAAAGLAVGGNNAIARRGMHVSFIEACIRIATTVAELACLMASLSFSLARRARFDGLPVSGIIGLRLLRRKPGVACQGY
jgi:hypothetical protein